MKNATDPRHIRRIRRMQSLFAYDAGNPDPTDTLLPEITPHLTEIDNLISAHAPKWPLDKINKVDLAILRSAVWEIKNSQTPPKVIIDESVEIAKQFGTDHSGPFINGVLGGILKHDQP